MQSHQPTSKPGKQNTEPQGIWGFPHDQHASGPHDHPDDPDGKDQHMLNEYMDHLSHRLKAEAQALREIILKVHPGITEQLEWDSPCFNYKGYMVTFNLRSPHYVNLVFHYGALLEDHDGFLQGDYPDRRMVYFKDMQDVKARQPVLERVIREWVELMDDNQAKWEAKAHPRH